MHDFSASLMREVIVQKNEIASKYREVTDREKWSEVSSWDYMIQPDAELFASLYRVEESYRHKLYELVMEAFFCLSADAGIRWIRHEFGASGTLSEANSRKYRAELDEYYSLELSWYNYLELKNGVRRESYSAGIVGEREVIVDQGFMGLGIKTMTENFPANSIGVGRNEDGEYKLSSDLGSIDESTRHRLEIDLIRFIDKLRKEQE